MKKCEKGSAFYGVFLKTILRGRAKIKIMESAIDSRFHYCSSGTDGLRLLCRQFYTSSNYPQVPSIASSNSSCHRKIKFLLSLRHSAGLGRKTFPTASLLRSGRLCLRESKTMHPIA